ncbi:hypothetical protein AN396_00020 [Candidatus Epulonipiscium fishelsonii]|uniref:Uncharacterized protein n=1 Tax=Candidatus Epulonipiscium fishelsonii TaxID=77094 RepID=A0ACC8XGU2_9FIRM|nr:hypothetical protein AN396_00020 [Epulopiscium sp. SCG-B11WGA-EpuloA1]
MGQIKGNIFNIQRFSVNDGPGIRTTVFTKGCNLRCKWCHNPESFKKQPQILFNKEKCTLCNRCNSVCEQNIPIDSRNKSSECKMCGKCIDQCYFSALSIVGEEKTPEEIIKIVEKDKLFYENSNGGITISGGEAMLQVDFIKEVFRLAKQKEIHTALDTAGNVSFDKFEQVLPFVDLILFDIKSMDNKTHMKFTGVSNELILDNLKKLLSRGIEMHIRVPLIKDINDSLENIIDMMALLQGYENVTEIKLLPYHNMGENKASSAGIIQEVFEAPSEIHIKQLEDLIRTTR